MASRVELERQGEEPIPLSRWRAAAGSPREAALPAFDDMVRRAARRPEPGWRRTVHLLTAGLVNLGPSPAQLRREQLEVLARTPVRGRTATVGVGSGKGGVGKTTIAGLLASRLGLLRHDRVIALDANPDAPTLGLRIRTESRRTVVDLLARGGIERHADLRDFTSQVPEQRLEVLPGPLEPAREQPLGEADYARVLELLGRFYDVVVADLGTGLLDEPNRWLVGRACDQIVVVVQPNLDSARIGAFTLDHIEARRSADWVRERAVVVVNGVRPDTAVDVGLMSRYFARRVRAVQRIGWDPELALGGIFDWGRLRERTRDEYLELAAVVGAGFALGRSEA